MRHLGALGSSAVLIGAALLGVCSPKETLPAPTSQVVRTPDDRSTVESAHSADSGQDLELLYVSGRPRSVARAPVRRPAPGGSLRRVAGSGPVLLLDPDHVSHPKRERRGEGAPPTAAPPRLQEAGAHRREPQPGLVMGHHQADGTGQMDLLLSLRDHRHLQPEGRGQARRRRRKRRLVQAAVRGPKWTPVLGPGVNPSSRIRPRSKLFSADVDRLSG